MSGAMIEALYGPAGADCHVQGFETAALADASIDLFISNVSFRKLGIDPTTAQASTPGSIGRRGFHLGSGTSIAAWLWR